MSSINLRYRGQKEEDQVQYVSTRASVDITSSGGSPDKKSSSTTIETVDVDEHKEETTPEKEEISEELIKGERQKEMEIEDRKKRLLGKLLVRKKEEIPGKPSDEFRLVQIPAVVCSSKLSPRVLPTDVVRKIRDCLWSSPSDPPPIRTPSELCYIRKKGDQFEDAIEKLRRETEIGVSAQLETRGDLARKGVLSLLSIATPDTVFIFDILEIGREAFKWGLGVVLTNPHCVKITHDSRLLREAFGFYEIFKLFPE